MNIGCGRTPLAGWSNFDNSLSVRLSGYPTLASLLGRLGLFSPAQQSFIAIVRRERIGWCDARRIPLADASVEVLYSCHMLEHLDRQAASAFLAEVRRVLLPNGVVRIVVPDLRRLVKQYEVSGDADAFVERTLLAQQRRKGPLAIVHSLLVGQRHHLWMYDGESLTRLLKRHGFRRTWILPAGETTIDDPSPINLQERSEDSVYVEARKA